MKSDVLSVKQAKESAERFGLIFLISQASIYSNKRQDQGSLWNTNQLTPVLNKPCSSRHRRSRGSNVEIPGCPCLGHLISWTPQHPTFDLIAAIALPLLALPYKVWYLQVSPLSEDHRKHHTIGSITRPTCQDDTENQLQEMEICRLHRPSNNSFCNLRYVYV